MKRTSWKRTMMILGAGVVFAGTVFSQAPPFDGRVVMEGSMIYQASDYTKTGPAPVSMNPDGLRVFALGANEETSIQHKTTFTPTAGLVARARFRLFVDHIGDNDSKFGFWSTTSDIFGIEDPPDLPDDGAYFFVKHVDCRHPQCPVTCTEDECEADRVLREGLRRGRGSDAPVHLRVGRPGVPRFPCRDQRDVHREVLSQGTCGCGLGGLRGGMCV